ncbi:phosphonate metabolism transcriptional regulator PhnF [Puniceibacterium sediminis]|uniref:GntR family transcriptional regulator, phosphonate transport system regulatory protein n=1 Tax=Puniceibacterium sediminis TaxID=1608407 RepID=A0A238VMW0_9RHOB|nr:phosphonate metabolism transcriptional regulator PhnF [Puniceibacterium sediminis]SNR34819.1 GntR family transcriptional regulator, phosphonate transport system regulatory protein [Puniceibacterium sediminis]
MPRTPLWHAIATALTQDIADTRYTPGDKLPTEAELSARFGVNRHTVRRALAELADQGLVHARRGSGVFVTPRPTDYPIGKRVRFHQNLRAAGRLPDREILSQETRRADATEAEALNLPPGALVHICRGLSLADGQPIALFISAFPADPLPNLPEALQRLHSVTDALAEGGVTDYTRASTRLTAVPADATQALHLRLTEGDPLLRSVAINQDTTGRPVEYGLCWFAGDRVTLTLSD